MVDRNRTGQVQNNNGGGGENLSWNTYDTNFKGLVNAGKNNCFVNVVI